MKRPIQVDRDCVLTDRGGIIENSHGVHVAITDSNGKLLFSVGNPSRVTLARSAAKPAQALAVLETGGFEQSGFDDADLALMCASHSSEERHITRARKMLAKAQAEESHLRCGGHAAGSDEVNRAWIKADYTPTGICNNCSGKHAAMLAGARALGADLTDYHLPDHPMQKKVKQVVESLCPNPDSIQWGIDGCNLPAPAFPLHYLARIFAIFADAADLLDKEGPGVSTRTRNSARIFHAMTSHPELVGGTGRFCTALMEKNRGQMIGKIGADACYGVGIRESEQTRRLGADGAIGIAVKIEDGSLDILYAVVVEVLEQLQIGTVEVGSELERFHHLQLKNTMGVVTGRASFSFKVQSV
ncbi:L-asparaginase II [Ilyonectria robusta]|uniref:L-asparaginase II n=1 Tax=Ilyonectria robusta TaxID=1079257 RepID=UPI001E8DD081|nr:L-asparaginase II [Ilyonectria robusta]KAH8665544.1 L-asparaginase II [Ilyonectria robusta]